MTLKQRVKKGASLLDAKKPKWYKKINVKKLNLSSLTNCVLGQLYGGYIFGLTKLKFPFWGNKEKKFGFVVPGTKAHNKKSKKLKASWKKQIRKRKAA